MPVTAQQFDALRSPSEKPSCIIRAVEVKKVYRTGTQETHALRGATLEIHRGEYLSIMGPSGSGKSTLFNMIGALSKPTSGKVYIDQVDVAQLDFDELAWFRCRKIGYIFQSYNLIGTMTCLENVMLPMSFAGTEAEEGRERSIELLKLVGLGHRILHKPGELSGGQQQRIAIARSLANRPEIILADEPTANLDSKSAGNLLDIMLRLNQEEHITFLFSTHDQRVIDRARRVITLEDGKVVHDEVAK